MKSKSAVLQTQRNPQIPANGSFSGLARVGAAMTNRDRITLTSLCECLDKALDDDDPIVAEEYNAAVMEYLDRRGLLARLLAPRK